MNEIKTTCYLSFSLQFSKILDTIVRRSKELLHTPPIHNFELQKMKKENGEMIFVSDCISRVFVGFLYARVVRYSLSDQGME